MTMEFLSSGIPEELKARACWVGWRYEESKDRPKPTKVPLDPNVWSTVKRASCDLSIGCSLGTYPENWGCETKPMTRSPE